MLKMALFDCAINKKCCSVDEGRLFALFFRSHHREIDSSRVPHPEICHPRQKSANARGSAHEGGWGVCWVQVELTDA